MRAKVSKLMKGASYALLAIGLLMLLGVRLSGDVARLFDDAIAFATLAASCLLYAIAPDAGEVRVEHAAILGHLGIDYRPMMGRLANAVAGLLLLWLAFG